MKDRVVQYPHRYRLVPVSGQNDVYDIVAAPGAVTEVGTPLNRDAFLRTDTISLYRYMYGFNKTDSEATPDDLFKLISRHLGDSAKSVWVLELSCICYNEKVLLPNQTFELLEDNIISGIYTTDGDGLAYIIPKDIRKAMQVRTTIAQFPFGSLHTVALTKPPEGEILPRIAANIATVNSFDKTFTSSKSYSGLMPPVKRMKMNIHLVGGGASGGLLELRDGGGGGGGGGYTTTATDITLVNLTGVNIVVGSGASGVGGSGASSGYSGGSSTIRLGGIGDYTANGGTWVNPGEGYYFGGNGGSGGGAPDEDGYGGSDGGNGGQWKGGVHRGGSGQGRTTRDWGQASGTLRSGGGGGSVGTYNGINSGGKGGGGRGDSSANTPPTDGVNGYGGGGGGALAGINQSGRGGSGIILMQLI